MFPPSGPLRTLLPFSWPRSHSVDAVPASWPPRLLWVNTRCPRLCPVCVLLTLCLGITSVSAPGPLHTPLLSPRELSFSSCLRPTSYSSECDTGPFLLTGSTLWFCLWTFKPHRGVGTPSSPWPPTWELLDSQHRPGMRVPGRTGYFQH